MQKSCLYKILVNNLVCFVVSSKEELESRLKELQDLAGPLGGAMPTSVNDDGSTNFTPKGPSVEEVD